jgi:hypothetical protein
MFLTCILRPSSGRFIALMMDAVCTSETLVYSSETTLRHIPEDSQKIFVSLVLSVSEVQYFVKYKECKCVTVDF